jgi:hypothetical protein
MPFRLRQLFDRCVRWRIVAKADTMEFVVQMLRQFSNYPNTSVVYSSRVGTPFGEQAIETLQVGDKLMTRNTGL